MTDNKIQVFDNFDEGAKELFDNRSPSDDAASKQITLDTEFRFYIEERKEATEKASVQEWVDFINESDDFGKIVMGWPQYGKQTYELELPVNNEQTHVMEMPKEPCVFYCPMNDQPFRIFAVKNETNAICSSILHALNMHFYQNFTMVVIIAL